MRRQPPSDQFKGLQFPVGERRQDGTTFPIELAVSEIRLGERRLFTGMIRDITERKQAEEALRREPDFAEGLIETAQCIVLLLDCNARILRHNRFMEELTGYEPDEARGRDWYGELLPERERDRIREA